MQKNIVIKEYEEIREDDGKLDKNAFENLWSFVLNNRNDDKKEPREFFYPSYKGSCRILKAKNWVGLIETKNGYTVEILPKIAKVNKNENTRKIFIKMLKRLRNSPFKNLELSHIKKEKMNLFEIFIRMFLDELKILVQKGIAFDYIELEENSSCVKGKIYFPENIRKNLCHKKNIYYKK